MLTSALSNATSGLFAAQQATQVRANNVANLNTEDFQAQQPIKQPTGDGVQVALKPGPGAGVELTSEMTGLLIEEQAFAANAEVVKTTDDMMDELLKIAD